MRRSNRPRPSGSPTATARLRGRARLPGLGGSRRCSGRTRGSPKSCRPARRSSPSGVELSGTLFIAVSDHLAAHSHFIIQMASSASGIRPSSVCGMRCNPSWSEPGYCCGSASSMWNALQSRCRRRRRNGISTATHRRRTCSDCKRRHRYSFGLSGSRSLCRSFRSGSARSACSLSDS